MITLPSRNNSIALILAGIFIASSLLESTVHGGQCDCPPDLCCSEFYYCGLGDPYCGPGCREGPCYNNTVNVSEIVTDDFFNGIINKSSSSCPGHGFYTRDAFLDAANSYSLFGAVGSVNDSKREIAAFFAHVTYQTIHFCLIVGQNGTSSNYCVNSTTYPCGPCKEYYGRGPIQISYNYNYGEAGDTIGFDGLGSPETVATDRVISFKSALWFWMLDCHFLIYRQGFGATTRAVNEGECNGGNSDAVHARAGYYIDYCNQFGVSPGDGYLYC